MADDNNFTWIEPPQFTPAKLVESKNGRHYYITPQGVYYPSPTTMFSKLTPFEKSPIYPKWTNSLAKIAQVPIIEGKTIAKYISKIAMSNGTTVHSLIENYLHNTQITGTIELLPWAHLENIKPLLHNIDNIRACEIPLYSDIMRMAGTADCVAEYNNKLSIIDFKTSNKKKDENTEQMENYFLQATCYAKMWDELTNQPIEQIAILISCNDGNLQAFVKKPSDYGGLLSAKLKEFEKIGGYSN